MNIKTLNKQPKLILIFAACGSISFSLLWLFKSAPGVNGSSEWHMLRLFYFAALLLVGLKTTRFLVVLTVMCLYSCTGRPSEKDITQKILLEYVCPENAKVDDLKIINLKEIKSC